VSAVKIGTQQSAAARIGNARLEIRTHFHIFHTQYVACDLPGAV
jgi:hypothetical protein